MSNTKYLTKHQLCELLEISRATLDRRVAEGKIPAYYPLGKGTGRPIRFHWPTVKKQLKRRWVV